MERVGIIVEERGEYALVKLQRHVSCEKCGRCGILSSTAGQELQVEVLNPVKARSGERVVVKTDDSQVLFLSFMLYMVPILALAGGILLWPLLAARLGLFGNQDLPAVACGFGLMALVFAGIRTWDRRVRNSRSFKAVITGLAADQEDS